MDAGIAVGGFGIGAENNHAAGDNRLWTGVVQKSRNGRIPFEERRQQGFAHQSGAQELRMHRGGVS